MQTWTNSQPMPRLALTRRFVAGDAMADAVEPAELLDVDVDEFARVLALVAATGSAGSRALSLFKPRRSQDAADGGRRDAGLGRDLLAGQALAAQRFDLLDDLLRRRLVQPVRPRAAVLKSGQTLRADTGQPICAPSAGRRLRLVRRPSASARSAPGARSALDRVGVRRAFLCMFIRSSGESLKLRNLSFLGPDRMDNLLKAHI